MKNLPPTKCSGYSLIEILTVVAVIGILAAIALNSVSRIHDSARLASAKRNAQEAASLSAAAEAAGITHVIPELAGGIEATLAFLSEGISTRSETGIPIDLKLPLSVGEITQAAQFLKLKYTETGIIMEYNNNP